MDCLLWSQKNLVRCRFIVTLGVVAIIGLIALLLTGGQGARDRILGSGSTFAQPLIERTAVDFQNARSGDEDWTAGSTGVDYEPIGSLGGIMRLRDPEVDFAVADYLPLSAKGITHVRRIWSHDFKFNPADGAKHPGGSAQSAGPSRGSAHGGQGGR
jgi:hypothetical protein